MIAPLNMTFYCKPKDGDGVYHTFPVDSSANHETADRWARQIGRWSEKTLTESVTFEFANEGFDHVEIVDLYHRGNGGRAYQVVIHKDGHKFRLDLREDTLMEVIEKKGIQAGGRLNGTFCFVKKAAQTELILEGTDAHKRAIAEREKRAANNKTIKKSDLKAGYLYETVSGSKGMFVGHAYTADVDEDGNLGKPYKAMVFIDGGEETCRKYHQVVLGMTAEKDFSWYHSKVQKSHSYKIEHKKIVDEIDINAYLSKINESGKLRYDAKMEEDWYTYRTWDRDDAFKYYQASSVSAEKKDFNMSQEEVERIFNKQRDAVAKSHRTYWR